MTAANAGRGTMETLDLLESQLDKNTELIVNVPGEKWVGATPCAKFDTRALTNHMALANMFFVSVASGDPMHGSDGDDMPDVLGDDPVAVHRESATRLMKVLRAPGTLERTFDFGFAQMPGAMGVGLMLMETTVHGWDLAKATGQDTSIDPDVAGMLLQAAGALDGIRSPDGTPFGPAVDVPESAPPGDRLIAFAGRTP